MKRWPWAREACADQGVLVMTRLALAARDTCAFLMLLHRIVPHSSASTVCIIIIICWRKRSASGDIPLLIATRGLAREGTRNPVGLIAYEMAAEQTFSFVVASRCSFFQPLHS